MKGLGAGQRRRFSTLMNSMVDAGMCRAPLCKPSVLPVLPVSYSLLTDLQCADFLDGQASTNAFEASVLASFAAVAPAVPAVVAVAAPWATVIGYGRRRGRGRARIVADHGRTSGARPPQLEDFEIVLVAEAILVTLHTPTQIV